jgi:hypothetical protein
MSFPEAPLALRIACLRDPGPESAVFVTSRVPDARAKVEAFYFV